MNHENTEVTATPGSRSGGFLSRHRRFLRRFILAMWVFTISFLVLFPLYIWAVIENPNNWFGGMPKLRDIENPKSDLSSEVISADGKSLGRYFRYNRSMVFYDELSPELTTTLITSEDHRFYEHSGVDLHAFGRVLAGVLTFDNQGGGSTLTQQTAKNLFRTREDELRGSIASLASPLDILISKTKEWIIAVELEQTFTKEEIIALYLNTVPFSNHTFGIKVAAETYFQKQPSELNFQESALLVGMLQGTSLFNPIRHPERATRKRNQVLNKLQTHGYLSKSLFDSLTQLPLQLSFTPQNDNEGLAPYFRNVLRNELTTWCRERGIDLEDAGLKIYTTIDSRLQRAAERAMKEHMANLQKAFDTDWRGRNPWVDDHGTELKDFIKRKIKRSDTYRELLEKLGENSVDEIERKLNEKQQMRIFSWQGARDTTFSVYDSLKYYNKFLHAGLMSVDPLTGEVKAWVGGINHAYFKFDHVKQSTRQPGSTFKPFVYGLAMENNYSPCQEFVNTSQPIDVNGSAYLVRNADGTTGDGQMYTIRKALAKSLNTVTMQLVKQLQPANVTDFAYRVGIASKLDPVYSIGLGTSDVSLYEMVGAYATFANAGVHTTPYYITRIEDRNGNVLENFLPTRRQSLDEETAYKILYLLRGGVEEEGGTSRGLSASVKTDNEIAGKTGTTDNGSDGWYIGATHNLVTGVWVGGDERSIHFPRWGESSGGKAALPIWDKLMQQVYEHPEYGYQKGKFKVPEAEFNFDCSKYIVQDSVFQETGF
jgi:penicillin-binding protein 1A